MGASGQRVFRPRVALRLALAAAGVLWLVAFAALLRIREVVSVLTLIGCLALVIFFALLWAYHVRLRIAVDDAGVTYRGLSRQLRVDFDEILEVDVNRVLLLTTYLVLTRKGLMLFSSHFKGHRELLALLIERARLGGHAP